ncbi:MAG TPA: deoxyribonuclease IV [Nitrososphaeraceae archaeon]|nr:deoxyribonuclease IV [Nitrososphaeraceae archaeon]
MDNALKENCTAFQIFSRNPRGWAAKPLDNKDVMLFKDKLAGHSDTDRSTKSRSAKTAHQNNIGEKSNKNKSKIDRNAIFVHMPYLPNLSSPNKKIYDQSVQVMIDELERSGTLEIPYLVVHLGSHQGEGIKKGVEQLVMACSRAIDSVSEENNVSILLENSAGQKNTVASDFEDLRVILDKLYDYNSGSKRDRFGICLDTCHAFASGYDLTSKDAVDKTMDKFDSQVGYKHLKLIHLNDSRDKFLSRRDRHEHLGLGEIGENGFNAFLKHVSHRNLPLIMETPIDSRRSNSDNLKFVKDIIGNE